MNERERYLLGLVLQDVSMSRKIGGDIEIMREFINEAIEASQDDTLLESYDKEMALYDCAFSIGEESGQRRGEEIGQKRGEEIGQKRGEEIGQKRGEKIGQKRGEEIGRQVIIKKLLEGGFDKSKLENVLGIMIP